MTRSRLGVIECRWPALVPSIPASIPSRAGPDPRQGEGNARSAAEGGARRFIWREGVWLSAARGDGGEKRVSVGSAFALETPALLSLLPRSATRFFVFPLLSLFVCSRVSLVFCRDSRFLAR